MKKLSEMTDEERYGKVGAEIRRLDPEAFKNRSDKSAAANMKLLRELRAKKKEGPMQEVTVSTKKETQAEKDRRTPGSGAGFKQIAANLGTSATRAKYREQGYGSEKEERGESAAQRRMREGKKSPAMLRMENREESVAERRMKEGPRSFSDRMKSLAARFGTQGQRDKYRAEGYKKGGSVKSSASRRADGIAKKGKTRGRMI
jgi:hypothetical protein